MGVKQLGGRVVPGAIVIVDGTRGDVVIDPTEEVLETYRARAVAQRRRDTQLLVEKDLPALTTDGVGIHLRANVESLLGVASVTASGAEGIGLFRTEFLYLERTDLPTEEEQYRDALSVLNAVGGLPVTFRTLDLGGDKLPAAFRMPEGANPALGVRSIRFSLERPDIFRTQLRALYRASASGPMRMILPLVTGPDELQRALAICASVRADLAAEGVAHDPRLPLGIMLETPSAAVTVDLLAREVDFFSIGTNDLIQYAFAADRENDDVAHLRHPLQPAVLRLLKQMIDAAAHARVPISICGDMAGDPALTWLLLGLGLRDLSMDPHSIPMVKAIIRRSSLADAAGARGRGLEVGERVGDRPTHPGRDGPAIRGRSRGIPAGRRRLAPGSGRLHRGQEAQMRVILDGRSKGPIILEQHDRSPLGVERRSSSRGSVSNFSGEKGSPSTQRAYL